MSYGLLAICLSFYIIEISPDFCLNCKIAAYLHTFSLICASSFYDKLPNFMTVIIPLIWVCTLPFLVFSLKGYLSYGDSQFITGVRRNIVNLSDVEIILGSIVIILSAMVSVQLSTLWLGLGVWSLSLVSMCAGFFIICIGSIRPSYGERKLISTLPVLLLFMVYFSAALRCISTTPKTLLFPEVLKLNS